MILLVGCLLKMFFFCRLENWALSFGTALWETARAATKFDAIQKVNSRPSKQLSKIQLFHIFLNLLAHSTTVSFILKQVLNNVNSTVEASITKRTFYHIRCFLLSKDASTPNLAEFGPVTRARETNLALNQSRIEILRVRKKLQNRQKLMTF